MVQLASVAAINSDVEATLTLTGETAEAQEARISKLYANALQLQRNGAPAEAAVSTALAVVFVNSGAKVLSVSLCARIGYVRAAPY